MSAVPPTEVPYYLYPRYRFESGGANFLSYQFPCLYFCLTLSFDIILLFLSEIQRSIFIYVGVVRRNRIRTMIHYRQLIVKLFIRFWPMVDLNHVFNLLASENDLSCGALVAPSTMFTSMKTFVIRLLPSVCDGQGRREAGRAPGLGLSWAPLSKAAKTFFGLRP